MNYKTGKDISEWDDSYSVGIDSIDEQHKALFELTALFYNRILDGLDKKVLSDVLMELRDYAKTHFEYEESLFKNHPEYSFHQQIHQAFLAKIEQLERDFQDWKEDIHEDALSFLRHWLVNHIITTDKRFLVQNRTGNEPSSSPHDNIS